MHWFTNLKTAHKLGLGFSLGIVITLIVAGVCVVRIGNIADALTNTYKDELLVGKVGELRGDILRYHRAEKCLILAADKAEMAKFQSQMNNDSQAFETDLKGMKDLCYLEKGRKAAATIEEAWGVFRPISAHVVELASANK